MLQHHYCNNGSSQNVKPKLTIKSIAPHIGNIGVTWMTLNNGFQEGKTVFNACPIRFIVKITYAYQLINIKIIAP